MTLTTSESPSARISVLCASAFLASTLVLATAAPGQADPGTPVTPHVGADPVGRGGMPSAAGIANPMRR